MLVFLFICAAIALGALVFFGMIGDQQMPWSCPRCQSGSDEIANGFYMQWYKVQGPYIRCRTCLTRFKEHPNGSLVEAPER